MPTPTARPFGACLTLLLLVPSTLPAQMRASERAAVSQTIDGTVITIDYARPQVRGRDSLFGGVEHWGAVWTPGANWATTLEVNRPLKLDGHPLAPGKYSLWLVIQPEEWTMVIDPRHRLYHFPYPDSTADQIRYQVKPGTGPFNEMLTFTFENVRGDEGTLYLRWGTTQVTFHVEVEPKHKLTMTAAAAKPYLGTYNFRWTGQADSVPPSKTTLTYENGMLMGRWEPAPWPEISTFILVEIKEDWFLVGQWEQGRLTDLDADWVFEFAKKGGAVTGYEVWGEKDKPDATATRE
ncbi:MAG TPA: DUF2911 domain-containing protein [Gemmatimonadales bacterium]|jgi:hypothetical protein|nr:DUF2911 domain-containing protein [Gemmatimonadales bacterium]